MFFSVVITTYGDRNNKLKRAINSVLNQTLKDFEIIVVDDNGSNLDIKNKNKELVENLKEKQKIKYFTYSENKGANFARNYGIKKSQGDYIAFLDDDDEFLPQKLEFIYKELLKEDIDLIYSDIVILNGKRKNIIKKEYYLNEKEIKKEILKRVFIGQTSNVVVRKRKIEEVGFFNEDLPSFQDWDMWIRIVFANGKIKKINKVLTNIYEDLTEKTRISNNGLKRLEGYKYIYSQVKKKYIHIFNEEDRKEIMFFQNYGMAYRYYENFDFKEYRNLMAEIFNLKYFSLKDYLKYIFSYLNLKITKRGLKK